MDTLLPVSRKECFNCGAPADTKEHVIPRGFFPASSKSYRITVPACQSCNNALSLDEEYLRVVLLAATAYTTPITDELWNGPIRRGFDRPKFDGLRRQLLRRTKPVYLPQGETFAECGLMKLDAARMDRVVCKVLKGLYYDVQGRRIPEEGMIRLTWQPKIWIPFPRSAVRDRRVDPRVFNVDYCIVSNQDSERSGWWMRFYESVEYYASVRIGSVAEAVHARA